MLFLHLCLINFYDIQIVYFLNIILKINIKNYVTEIYKKLH